jgi:hypothetical protein
MKLSAVCSSERTTLVVWVKVSSVCGLSSSKSIAKLHEHRWSTFRLSAYLLLSLSNDQCSFISYWKVNENFIKSLFINIIIIIVQSKSRKKNIVITVYKSKVLVYIWIICWHNCSCCDKTNDTQEKFNTLWKSCK